MHEYTRRILGYVEGTEPLAAQAAAAQTLNRLIASVPAERLRERPAPEKWSVSEVVAHLADAEIVIGYRIRLILGSPGAPIAAYDQDRWATSGHYDARDARTSAAHFRAVREANLALLESLDAEQWLHYGIHSERGQESIQHIVRMTAGHDLNHLRQIEEILGG